MINMCQELGLLGSVAAWLLTASCVCPFAHAPFVAVCAHLTNLHSSLDPHPFLLILLLALLLIPLHDMLISGLLERPCQL